VAAAADGDTKRPWPDRFDDVAPISQLDGDNAASHVNLGQLEPVDDLAGDPNDYHDAKPHSHADAVRSAWSCGEQDERSMIARSRVRCDRGRDGQRGGAAGPKGNPMWAHGDAGVAVAADDARAAAQVERESGGRRIDEDTAASGVRDSQRAARCARQLDAGGRGTERDRRRSARHRPMTVNVMVAE